MCAAYATLGVSPGDSFDDIRRAYKKRLVETHPDRGGSSAQFIKVKRAFAELSKHERKCVPPPTPLELETDDPLFSAWSHHVPRHIMVASRHYGEPYTQWSQDVSRCTRACVYDRLPGGDTGICRTHLVAHICETRQCMDKCVFGATARHCTREPVASGVCTPRECAGHFVFLEPHVWVCSVHSARVHICTELQCRFRNSRNQCWATRVQGNPCEPLRSIPADPELRTKEIDFVTKHGVKKTHSVVDVHAPKSSDDGRALSELTPAEYNSVWHEWIQEAVDGIGNETDRKIKAISGLTDEWADEIFSDTESETADVCETGGDYILTPMDQLCDPPAPKISLSSWRLDIRKKRTLCEDNHQPTIPRKRKKRTKRLTSKRPKLSNILAIQNTS